MRALTLILALTAAASYAADTVLYGPGPESAPTGRYGVDETQELRWDNGAWKYFVWWYTGEGSWAGNDFTLPGGRDTDYWRIDTIKVFSTTVAPNERWDGFRVALFAFDGEPEPQPGEMLWPEGETGYFFQPGGLTGHVWVEIPINWVTPAPRLVAAMEQVYNEPRCDPFAVDTNRTFRRHSWSLYDGVWRLLQTTSDPYLNLMLRLVVSGPSSAPGVAPTSFGRVKALYY